MKKIITSIAAASLIAFTVPVSVMAEETSEEWTLERTSELSSFSVYSKDYNTSRNLEYTVPIGYDFTIDDVENLVFRKTYEVSHLNIDGEKIIDRYDSEMLTMEEIQKECEITTRFNIVDATTKKFVIGLNYTGDEAEHVLVNSLFVTVNYDIDDHSCYGENYLTGETYIGVKDGEYSGYYIFSENKELSKLETLGIEERPYISVTKDNNKLLLDIGAFYVQAEYSFNFHAWYYNKIIKNDTVKTELYGWVEEIDDEKNTFTVAVHTDNRVEYIEYPIAADYVNIFEDLDTGNMVYLFGYNVTADDWYTNPDEIFVEPSHKVTIKGKVTGIYGNMVKADFIGMGELSYYVSDTEGFSEGDILCVKNFGDAIDEEWLNSPMEVWLEKNPDNISKEEIVYGDATCDGEVDIRDITAINQHIVELKILSEQGVKNCNIFLSDNINVMDLGQIKKYVVKMIDKLAPVEAPEAD